jgi:hypothetical protein
MYVRNATENLAMTTYDISDEWVVNKWENKVLEMEARAMKNLVSINRNKVLGTYINAQNRNRIPDDTYFYAGVFLSAVLPQFIFFIYGGFLPLLAFAVSGLAGSTLGLASYYWLPYRPLSCVNGETEAQVPPREDTSRKKAA